VRLAGNSESGCSDRWPGAQGTSAFTRGRWTRAGGPLLTAGRVRSGRRPSLVGDRAAKDALGLEESRPRASRCRCFGRRRHEAQRGWRSTALAPAERDSGALEGGWGEPVGDACCDSRAANAATSRTATGRRDIATWVTLRQAERNACSGCIARRDHPKRAATGAERFGGCSCMVAGHRRVEATRWWASVPVPRDAASEVSLRVVPSTSPPATPGSRRRVGGTPRQFLLRHGIGPPPVRRSHETRIERPRRTGSVIPLPVPSMRSSETARTRPGG
jgi:hypothetical protein